MKIRLNLTAAFIAATMLVLGAAYKVNASPTLTAGGLLQFTSQTEFQQAFPGLPKEDFEESPVGAGDHVIFSEPLNSTTDASGAFAPGDILPGLAIQTVEGIHPTEALFVGGSGDYNNTSKAVGINWWVDTMDISFPGNAVNAAGMGLMLHSTAATVTVSIYGSGGNLLDTLTPTIQTTETFYGIYSNQPITRITVASPGQGEIVDNIQFGTLTPNVTFYTSQAAFEAAHPGLPKEDFEESGVADDEFIGFQSPLNSASNVPPAFVPGDIIPGLQIGLTAPPSPSDLVVAGRDGVPFPANDSKAVFAGKNVLDGLVIELTNYSAYAAGMDLSLHINADATIVLYKPLGQILGVTTWSLLNSAETFFGVSSNDNIAKIIILTDGGFEMVDDIQFGGSLADLTFYQTETAFRNAAGTLLLEDFAEAPVADNMTTICNEPIDGSPASPAASRQGTSSPISACRPKTASTKAALPAWSSMGK